MRKYTNHSFFQYALIVCLAITLVLGHASKLHIHIEHENTQLAGTEIHKVDLHVASYLHEATHDSNHHNDIQQHHNSIDIDVDLTTNNLVKKVQLLNPFVLLVLTLFVILCAPPLRQIRSWHQEKKLQAFSCCSPPQRAPPIF